MKGNAEIRHNADHDITIVYPGFHQSRDFAYAKGQYVANTRSTEIATLDRSTISVVSVNVYLKKFQFTYIRKKNKFCRKKYPYTQCLKLVSTGSFIYHLAIAIDNINNISAN